MQTKGSSSAGYRLVTMVVIAALVLASAGIVPAQAGNDTCAGVNATIGGTCIPLTNTTSGNNYSSAFGSSALQNNTTGVDNTATGANALLSNTTGSDNTATGLNALFVNTTGAGNTAVGSAALTFNTGDNNTATGDRALFTNSTGIENTATGESALVNNTLGGDNTATGAVALFSNTTGGGNTANGLGALFLSTTGRVNTADGENALGNMTAGDTNIAIGFNAGSALTTGSNNIDIGNVAVAVESNAIRIGTQGTQTSTFIAGIVGTPMSKSSASVVLIDSTGHLGVQVSSARYKRDIHDVGDSSDGLLKLRPVSYRYKQDPTGSMQYGLIAEDVEQVYPELVTHTADGKIQGVRYDLLPALLINEIQKQASDAKRKDAQIAELKRQAEAQRREIAALKKKDSQIDALAERMSALEQQARAPKLQHLASTMP